MNSWLSLYEELPDLPGFEHCLTTFLNYKHNYVGTWMRMENLRLAGPETIKLFNDREKCEGKAQADDSDHKLLYLEVGAEPGPNAEVWLGLEYTSDRRITEWERKIKKIHGRGTWLFHFLRCHLIHVKGSTRLEPSHPQILPPPS